MATTDFANLSHEFRTPLTMILGSLHDVLSDREEVVREKNRGRLEVAGRNARRLEQLINQLLALARLESGQMQLHLCRGDLVAFVEELACSFTPLAERRCITLQCFSVLDHLEADFDPEKLRTALGNLIANALKFTPEQGRVTVTVGEAEKQAVVRVRDTGIGIPEEAFPHIFDRFYQANGSATHGRGGTGIGLSLAKELVELHGGTVSAKSEPDVGSAFTVGLPLRHAQEDETEASEEESAGEKSVLSVEDGASEKSYPDPGTQPPEPGVSTVLIVEDSEDVRAYLKHHLAADYRVGEACNGKEALGKIREEPPDLVVSDVMMPEMDGIELCHALKTDEALRSLPVLLLTARAGEAERIEGLHTGADDYVEKPFSMAELKARIGNLIESRQDLRAQYSQEIVVQPTGITVTSEDEVLYQRARAVVEAHIDESNFTVERFAQAMGTTKSTLTRRLKAATGLTPATFVQELRLQRAAQLLEQGSGTVAEAAYAVGYRDASHFSKIFRETFGTSPSDYPVEDGAG